MRGKKTKKKKNHGNPKKSSSSTRHTPTKAAFKEELGKPLLLQWAPAEQSQKDWEMPRCGWGPAAATDPSTRLLTAPAGRCDHTHLAQWLCLKTMYNCVLITCILITCVPITCDLITCVFITCTVVTTCVQCPSAADLSEVSPQSPLLQAEQTKWAQPLLKTVGNSKG